MYFNRKRRPTPILMVAPTCALPTMAARRLAPALALDGRARAALRRTYDAAGLPVPTERNGIVRAPFRAPHHTVTAAALVGRDDKPGEAALAHGGILFLDQLAEFQLAALAALADVLTGEERPRFASVPAVVFCAMRPCKCGGFPICRCTRQQVTAHHDRVRPFLTRIGALRGGA